MKLRILFPALLTLILSAACSENEEGNKDISRAELITRKSGERLQIPPPVQQPLPQYPWDDLRPHDIPKITKEYFRCKGSYLNPEKTIERNGKSVRINDCEGSDRHGLPLDGSREFVYKILITLLNYIQNQTGKKVVITSGHRCPDHNAYVDPSRYNLYSKHQIGAEVSFYVQGIEDKPEKIVDLVFKFYRETSPYKEKQEFTTFHRYEKPDTNVSTKPWYNKEVFIKLFKKTEGRNFDNRHPYPYIGIQVRYDTDKKERVSYTWDKAYKQYLRK